MNGCAACLKPINEYQSSTNIWCGHLIHNDNDKCLKLFRSTKKCNFCINPTLNDIKKNLSIKINYKFQEFTI